MPSVFMGFFMIWKMLYIKKCNADPATDDIKVIKITTFEII